MIQYGDKLGGDNTGSLKIEYCIVVSMTILEDLLS